MSERPPQAEYLVISRGQWDRTLSRDEIQNAIGQFYAWLDRSVNEGKMKRGQRLTYEGKTIARQNVITASRFRVGGLRHHIRRFCLLVRLWS
jgi:hypothetical protein